MEKPYVEFMCASLMSALYDNNKGLADEKVIVLVLVKKDNTNHRLIVNQDNINNIMSRLLQYNSQSQVLSSIEIENNGKFITSIEIL